MYNVIVLYFYRRLWVCSLVRKNSWLLLSLRDNPASPWLQATFLQRFSLTKNGWNISTALPHLTYSQEVWMGTVLPGTTSNPVLVVGWLLMPQIAWILQYGIMAPLHFFRGASVGSCMNLVLVSSLFLDSTRWFAYTDTHVSDHLSTYMTNRVFLYSDKINVGRQMDSGTFKKAVE